VAKTNAFPEIRSRVGRILVPPSVWREAVDAGERIGAPEVERIRNEEATGFLEKVGLSREVEALARRIASRYRLGHGESEVLALAGRQGRAIVDEGRAARVAESMGIIVVSTLFLPVLGVQSGRMSVARATDFLYRLASVTGARAAAVLAVEECLRRGRR
jgi:predicted nucleic acid-binding protein